MSISAIRNPKVVSREEWLVARKQLLLREKQLTRDRDAIAAERRSLPWVWVSEPYVFESAGGRRSLGDLFEGRSQLLVYHFMFSPQWQEGCPSCSFVMDHTDATLAHLAQRDVAFVAISRAPLAKIEQFKKRMGWHFNWVSSQDNHFNSHYAVSFTKDELARGDIYNFGTSGHPSEEAPGFSVFFRDADKVFHTYSRYGRGVEIGMHTYNYLDLVPKGRDEEGLHFPMAWVRHHDRYEDGRLADPTRPYWPPEPASADTDGASCGCCPEEG